MSVLDEIFGPSADGGARTPSRQDLAQTRRSALPESGGSTFDTAIEKVLQAEGGYSNNAADRGGETNFGISSRANPDVNVKTLTRDDAKQTYRERYWNAIGADNLPPAIREIAFDAAVNHGVGAARQMIAASNGDPQKFLELRRQKYADIAANDPSQRQFSRGWANRLERFSPIGTANAEALPLGDEEQAPAPSPEDKMLAGIFDSDAPQFAAPKQDADPTWGDYARGLGNTMLDFAKALPAAAENVFGQIEQNVPEQYQAYFNVAGDYMRESRQSIKDWQDGLFANMTPAAKERLSREWATLDPSRSVWQQDAGDVLSTLALQGTNNLGPTIGPLLTSIILQRVGVGASVSTMFGASEGVISAGLTASQIAEDLEATPVDKLRETPRFAQLEQQLGEDGAREQYTKEVQSFIPVVTGALVGWMAKQIGRPLEKVFGTEGGMPLVQRALTTGAVEAAQEGPQSATEQIMQNYAQMAYDSDVDLFGGVLESVVQGMGLGFVLGGGTGAAFGNRPKPKVTQQTVSPDVQAAVGEATTEEAIPTGATSSTSKAPTGEELALEYLRKREKVNDPEAFLREKMGVPGPQRPAPEMGPPAPTDMWGTRQAAPPELSDPVLRMEPEQPWDPNAKNEPAAPWEGALPDPDAVPFSEVYGPVTGRQEYDTPAPSRKIGYGMKGEWIDESQQFDPIEPAPAAPGLTLVNEGPVDPTVQMALGLDTVEPDFPPSGKPQRGKPAMYPSKDEMDPRNNPALDALSLQQAQFTANQNREPTFGVKPRTEHIGAQSETKFPNRGSNAPGSLRGEYRVRVLDRNGTLLDSQLVPNRIEAQKLARQWESEGRTVQVVPSRRTFKNDAPPSAEPVRDLLAQAKALKTDPSRNAIYLSSASIQHLQKTGNLDEVLRAGVPINNVDMYGGILVARDERVAQQIMLQLDYAENADLDQIIGAATGAGSTKPAGANKVVQRLDEDGNVVQERLVADDQIKDTVAEFGENSRVMPLEWALTRRNSLIEEDLVRAQSAADEAAAQKTEPDKVREAYNEQFSDAPQMGDMAERLAQRGGVQEDIAGRLIGWAEAQRERDLGKRLDKNVPRPEEVSFLGREVMEAKQQVTRQKRALSELEQRLETAANSVIKDDTRGQKLRVQQATKALARAQKDYEDFSIYAKKSPERQKVLLSRLNSLGEAVKKAEAYLESVKAGTPHAEYIANLADIDKAIEEVEGTIKSIQGDIDGSKPLRGELADEYKALHSRLVDLAIRVEEARDENTQALLDAESEYDNHVQKMLTFLNMEGGYTRSEAMVKAANRYSPRAAKVTRAQIAAANEANDPDQLEDDNRLNRKLRKAEEAKNVSVETAAQRFARTVRREKKLPFRSDERKAAELKLYEYLAANNGSPVALEVRTLLQQWLSDYRYSLRRNLPVDVNEKTAKKRRDYVAAKTALQVASVLGNLRAYHGGQQTRDAATAYVAFRVMDLLAMGKRYGIGNEMDIDGFWKALRGSPESVRDYLKSVVQSRDTPALPSLTEEQLRAMSLADLDAYYVTALGVLGNTSRDSDGVRRELVSGLMQALGKRMKLSDKPITVEVTYWDREANAMRTRKRTVSPRKLMRESLTRSYGVRGADAAMDIKQLRELYIKGGTVTFWENGVVVLGTPVAAGGFTDIRFGSQDKSPLRNSTLRVKGKGTTITIPPVSRTLPKPESLKITARTVSQKTKVSTILRAVRAIEQGHSTVRANGSGVLASTGESFYNTSVLVSDFAPQSKNAAYEAKRDTAIQNLKDSLASSNLFLGFISRENFSTTASKDAQKELAAAEEIGDKKKIKAAKAKLAKAQQDLSVAKGYYRWIHEFGRALIKANLQSERGVSVMDKVAADLTTIMGMRQGDEFVQYVGKLASTSFKEEGRRIDRQGLTGAGSKATREAWLAQSLTRTRRMLKRQQRLNKIWPTDPRFEAVRIVINKMSDSILYGIGDNKSATRGWPSYRPTQSERDAVDDALRQWRTTRELPQAERIKQYQAWGVPADVAYNEFYRPLMQQLRAGGYFDVTGDSALNKQFKRRFTKEEAESIGPTAFEDTGEDKEGRTRRTRRWQPATRQVESPSFYAERTAEEQRKRELAGMDEVDAIIDLSPAERKERNRVLKAKVVPKTAEDWSPQPGRVIEGVWMPRSEIKMVYGKWVPKDRADFEKRKRSAGPRRFQSDTGSREAANNTDSERPLNFKLDFAAAPETDYGSDTAVERDVAAGLRETLAAGNATIGDVLNAMDKLGISHPYAPILRVLRGMPASLLQTKFGVNEGEGGLFTPEGAFVGRQTLRNASARKLFHTVVHEAIHGATLSRLANDKALASSWDALRQLTYEKLKNNPRIAEMQYGNSDLYEFVSEVFSNPVLQQAMKTTRVHGVAGRLWARFKALVKSVFGGTQQVNDTLWDYALSLQPVTFGGEPFTKRDADKIDRSQGVPFIDIKATASDLLNKMEQSHELFAKASRAAQDKLGEAKITGGGMLLNALSMRQIEDLYGDRFGADAKKNPMKRFFRAFFQRNSNISEELEKSDKLSREWTVLDESGAKNNYAGVKLSELMTKATYYGIHPDAAFTPGVENTPNGHLTEASRARWQELSQMYRELSGVTWQWSDGSTKSAADLYQAVKQQYKDQIDREVKLLLLNALRASKLSDKEFTLTEKDIDLSTVTKSKWLQDALGYNLTAEEQRVEDAEKALNDAIDRGAGREEISRLRKQWKNLSIDFDSVQKEIQLIARMASIPSKMDGPYFPLMRFGEYAVTANKTLETRVFDTREDRLAYQKMKQAEDPTLQFEYPETEEGFALKVVERELRLAETWTDAQQNYRDMVEDYGEGVVSKPQLKADMMKSNAAIESNSALQSLLGKLNGNYAAQAALRQFYLQSLSDSSFRKRELKRKNFRGVGLDKQHRAFASYSKNSAYYMAQLRYGHLMADARKDMEQYAREFAMVGDESEITAMRMSEIVREIDRRDQNTAQMMEPSKFVRRAVESGQLWLLASPSYWILNLTQPFMVTLPYLAAKSSVATATRHMAAAQALIADPLVKRGVKSWGGLRAAVSRIEAEKAFTVLEDVENRIREAQGKDSPLLTMLTELKRESIIDLSFIAELRNIAEGEKQGLWNKVMDATRIMAHLTEVNNRVMTAIAAYNLATEQGLDHGQAVQYAKNAVAETQFDYSAANKPRLFSANDAWWKPMVFQFMQYVQHMYVLFIKHFRIAKNAPFGSVEWRTSSRIVAGMLLTHLAAGGLLGVTAALPFKWVAGLLIMLAGGGDDEDRRWLNVLNGKLWDRWISEVITDMTGPGRTSVLIRKGIPAALGADVSSRVSFLQTYMVDLDPKTSETLFGSAALSFGGPSIGLAGQAWDGMSLLAEGQYERGFEKMAPKMIRDFLRSNRFADEGMMDNNGRTIKGADKLHPYDLFLQSMGFNPTPISETYERNAKAKDNSSYVDQMKANLGRRFRVAKTSEDMKKIYADIAEFNRMYPQYRIKYGELFRTRIDNLKSGYKIQQYGVDAGKRSYLYDDDTYDTE